MIAVVNNPDLKAMRGQLGVAEAQAFAAGLLPNPQFSFAATRQTFGWPCAGVDPRVDRLLVSEASAAVASQGHSDPVCNG